MDHGFVKVRFQHNAKDYFFKNILEGLSIGDNVIVDTIQGLQIAQVTGFPVAVERNVGRWTVDKVDLSHFKQVQDIREKEKETKSRKIELSKKMRKIYDQDILPEIYAEHAKHNPELAELLAEYNSL